MVAIGEMRANMLGCVFCFYKKMQGGLIVEEFSVHFFRQTNCVFNISRNSFLKPGLQK